MGSGTLPDVATQIEIYRRMVLIKYNDEHARRVIRSGRLLMPYYSPRGQEVIPSAISACLRPDDYVCTIYRGTHDMLAKGVPLKALWSELAGRATGTCKGKGGPMHITHPKSGVMITTGVVGSSLPIANGLAWASLLQRNGRVTVAYFGDGASNIGAFHEALNLAAVWKLPVLFVCQNNRYAEHTAYAKCTSARQVSDRAFGYQMAGLTVDGNDPLAVYAAAREAVDRARAGQGPTLIEAMTYRLQGHNMGDNESYIPVEEKKAAIERDPVPLFRTKLIAGGMVGAEELERMETQINREVEQAIELALDSPFPDLSELRKDVFAQEVVQ